MDQWKLTAHINNIPKNITEHCLQTRIIYKHDRHYMYLNRSINHIILLVVIAYARDKIFKFDFLKNEASFKKMLFYIFNLIYRIIIVLVLSISRWHPVYIYPTNSSSASESHLLINELRGQSWNWSIFTKRRKIEITHDCNVKWTNERCKTR